MLTISHNQYPDFNKYEQYISELGYIFMSKYKCDLKQMMYSEEYENATRILVDFMTCENPNFPVYAVTKDTVLRHLLDVEHIPESKLKIKTTKGLSLDQMKVLEPLRAEGRAVAFLNLYLYWKGFKTKREGLASLVGYFEDFSKPVLDWDDCELKKLSYSYEQRETGRYYSNNYNIQGINKDYITSISCPKDYFLLWCDFDQIDLRVAYNMYLRERGTEDDLVYSETADKYEAISRIIHAHLGKAFSLERFKEQRPKFKKLILSRIYNASKSTLYRDVPDWGLINELDKYFLENKKYQRFVNEIQKVIDFNGDITTEDYFGRPRVFPVNTSSQESSMSQSINTPVQSTSNGIVVHTVNAIMDELRAAGFGKDKACVYMIRHDEYVLMLHKDVIPYLWVIENFRTVKLDDWELFTSDYHLGFNYKDEDEDLMKLYNKVKLRNLDKIKPDYEQESRGASYTPVKREVNLHLATSEGRLGMVLECGNEESVFMWDSLTSENAQEVYRKYMPKICDTLKELGFSCVTIWDMQFISKDFRYEGLQGSVDVRDTTKTRLIPKYIKDLTEGVDIHDKYGNVTEVDLHSTKLTTEHLKEALRLPDIIELEVKDEIEGKANDDRDGIVDFFSEGFSVFGED